MTTKPKPRREATEAERFLSGLPIERLEPIAEEALRRLHSEGEEFRLLVCVAVLTDRKLKKVCRRLLRSPGFTSVRLMGAAANKAKAKARKDTWLKLANDLVTKPQTGIHDTDSMVNYIRKRYPGRDRDIRAVVKAAKRAARKALK